MDDAVSYTQVGAEIRCLRTPSAKTCHLLPGTDNSEISCAPAREFSLSNHILQCQNHSCHVIKAGEGSDSVFLAILQFQIFFFWLRKIWATQVALSHFLYLSFCKIFVIVQGNSVAGSWPCIPNFFAFLHSEICFHITFWEFYTFSISHTVWFWKAMLIKNKSFTLMAAPSLFL